MSPKSADGKGEKLIAKNRRATFDYALEDHYEAGMVLVGSEVKSLRAGKVEIVDAYATVENFQHEPRRKRKLLLRSTEIKKIGVALKDRGYTLIPLQLYFSGRVAKIEIALARGKTHGDKRQDIAKKDAAREARNSVGRSRKGG